MKLGISSDVTLPSPAGTPSPAVPWEGMEGGGGLAWGRSGPFVAAEGSGSGFFGFAFIGFSGSSTGFFSLGFGGTGT